MYIIILGMKISVIQIKSIEKYNRNKQLISSELFNTILFPPTFYRFYRSAGSERKPEFVL